MPARRQTYALKTSNHRTTGLSRLTYGHESANTASRLPSLYAPNVSRAIVIWIKITSWGDHHIHIFRVRHVRDLELRPPQFLRHACHPLYRDDDAARHLWYRRWRQEHLLWLGQLYVQSLLQVRAVSISFSSHNRLTSFQMARHCRHNRWLPHHT